MLRKAATSSFGIVKPSAACFAHTVSVTGSVAKPTVQVPAKTSSSPMDRDASSAVKSIIDSNRVVVFGKSYCPHTRDAKKAIEATGLHDGESGVKFVDMDREADGAAMQEALAFTGSTTVPRVFINGRFCGGGDDMVELQRTGRLKSLLQDAGGSGASGGSGGMA